MERTCSGSCPLAAHHHRGAGRRRSGDGSAAGSPRRLGSQRPARAAAAPARVHRARLRRRPEPPGHRRLGTRHSGADGLRRVDGAHRRSHRSPADSAADRRFGSAVARRRLPHRQGRRRVQLHGRCVAHVELGADHHRRELRQRRRPGAAAAGEEPQRHRAGQRLPGVPARLGPQRGAAHQRDGPLAGHPKHDRIRRRQLPAGGEPGHRGQPERNGRWPDELCLRAPQGAPRPAPRCAASLRRAVPAHLLPQPALQRHNPRRGGRKCRVPLFAAFAKA